MSEVADRVMDAAYDEVADRGLVGVTVEAVAARAGISRATIYRHFPGGRDEIVDRTVGREAERFFAELLGATAGVSDPVAAVAVLVRSADAQLRAHAMLQRLLRDEAEALLPSLATFRPMVENGLTAHLRRVLAGATRSPDAVASIDEVADYASHMILSYVGTGGSWNLQDPEAVARLVDDRILGGL